MLHEDTLQTKFINMSYARSKIKKEEDKKIHAL